MTRKIIVFCLVPLFPGALIYLFYRRQGILGLSFPARTINDPVIMFLIDTLPDFFWSFSLSNALYLYSASMKWSFVRSSLLIIVILLLAESAQLFIPHYFTFDFGDISAAVLAFLLSCRIFKRYFYGRQTI